MNTNEVIQYWAPAARRLLDTDLTLIRAIESWQKLDELLGVTEYGDYSASTSYVPLPPDLKKLLVWLRGPHAKTILKVYRIQKGLEGSDP